MSENREKLLGSEKTRIRKYLERLGEILNQERSIEGPTAGGGEPKGLAEEQAKLAGKTGDLAKDIKANEEGGAKPRSRVSRETGSRESQGSSRESQKQEAGKPGDSKPSQANPEQAKSGLGKAWKAQTRRPGKPGEGKPGEGKPGEGKPGQGKPGDGQTQGGTSPGRANRAKIRSKIKIIPARKRLEAAQQKMREAEENLKKAQREGAKGKQEEAIRSFAGQSRLERILRQLREEEVKRTLEALEARFTKMLQLQRVVYDGTIKLDKVPLARAHPQPRDRIGATWRQGG